MKKRHKAEQIVAKLREAEIELVKGRKAPEAVRKLGIIEQPYYRWRQHYNRVHPHSSLGYRPPAPEAVAIPAITAYETCGDTAPSLRLFPLRKAPERA